jgi:putative transcriptional regulator
MLYTCSVENKMKEIRIGKDINQTELAIMCRVSRQTIHSIESGKYTPSVELALRIAKSLKTTVEKVFILEDE